jgi:AcrR family transcriptional regulator
MGRRAGVTAEETRGQIIQAASLVFARRGYEGASIAEITAEAGLSSGPIYAHYGSKAELFMATLRAHTRDQVNGIVGRGGGTFLDALASAGAGLDQRSPTLDWLLIEAILVGQRDPEVALLLSAAFSEREMATVELARQAQAAGDLDPTVTAEAVARLTLIIALGALVASAIDLPALAHADWSGLITALAERGRPAPSPPPRSQP